MEFIVKKIGSMLRKRADRNDEPRNIGDTFDLKGWPYVAWPVSKQYRVICDENRNYNKLRLQAFYKGEWIEVMTYDDGYDPYGKLHPGKWVELSSECSWTKPQLERVAREAIGVRIEPSIVSEIEI